MNTIVEVKELWQISSKETGRELGAIAFAYDQGSEPGNGISSPAYCKFAAVWHSNEKWIPLGYGNVKWNGCMDFILDDDIQHFHGFDNLFAYQMVQYCVYEIAQSMLLVDAEDSIDETEGYFLYETSLYRNKLVLRRINDPRPNCIDGLDIGFYNRLSITPYRSSISGMSSL